MCKQIYAIEADADCDNTVLVIFKPRQTGVICIRVLRVKN